MKFPEQFRWRLAPAFLRTQAGESHGAFIIPPRNANGRTLKVIASCGKDGDLDTGWEHVSVSLNDHPEKCPSWDEMCIVKALFWEPGECVVQFHPAESEYVNTHPGVLHLWKSVAAPFPTPPKICV